MSLYDVGKTISYSLTSYAGLVDADVVYNDGKYAVAAFEFYGDNELDDFILSSDEVMLFVPANFGYRQNCYLIIDVETGFLVKRHQEACFVFRYHLRRLLLSKKNQIL